MPAVNGVGEPCAREPHARFEAAGAGNGADLTKGTGVAQPAGKPAENEGPRPYRQRATAPAPHPTRTGSSAEEIQELLTGVPRRSSPDGHRDVTAYRGCGAGTLGSAR